MTTDFSYLSVSFLDSGWGGSAFVFGVVLFSTYVVAFHRKVGMLIFRGRLVVLYLERILQVLPRRFLNVGIITAL